MRAIFSGNGASFTGTNVSFNVFDNTNTFLGSFTVSLDLTTDITPTTPGATLAATIVTKAIAAAAIADPTWIISASDVIFGGFSPFYPAEIIALQAAIQPRAYSVPTFASSTSATKLSTGRDAEVSYDYDATANISLLAGQSVTATLKYADNSGMSTNVVTVSSQQTGNSGVLGLTNVNTLKVSGSIPAGKFRQVTFAVTGGAAAPSAIKAGQEVLV